mgnify:CR=1 FL=1
MSINIQELNKWATLNFTKDNATLVADGAKIEKMVKVRAFLRGIIDCCKIIIANNMRNEQLTKTIEGYINELSKIGIMNFKSKEVKETDERS